MDCFKNYLIFKLSDDFITRENAKEILKFAYDHYKNRCFVFISSRDFVTNIDMTAYDFINSKRVVGFAIVSKDALVRGQATEAQGHFNGSFSFFPTEEEAADWANTVVK